jgi:hypothetical protein
VATTEPALLMASSAMTWTATTLRVFISIGG